MQSARMRALASRTSLMQVGCGVNVSLTLRDSAQGLLNTASTDDHNCDSPRALYAP